jgi:hypothetical protein
MAAQLRNATALLRKFTLTVRESFGKRDKRSRQQAIDVHRLFLYTSFYKHERLAARGAAAASAAAAAAGSTAPANDVAARIVADAEALGAAGQAEAVQAHLREQLLAIGAAVRDALAGLGDPLHAAAAFRAAAAGSAAASRAAAAAADAAAAAASVAAPSSSGGALSADQRDTAAPRERPRASGLALAAGGSLGPAPPPPRASTSGRPAAGVAGPPAGGGPRSVGMAALSERLAADFGFSLDVRPSSIKHAEAGACVRALLLLAGALQRQPAARNASAAHSSAASAPTIAPRSLAAAALTPKRCTLLAPSFCALRRSPGNGLFVRGHAPPGAVLAVFPGLAYGRPEYSRLPGYPKVDRGNPYLIARRARARRAALLLAPGCKGKARMHACARLLTRRASHRAPRHRPPTPTRQV